MEIKKSFSKEIISVAVVSSLSCGFLDAILGKPAEFYSVSFLLSPPVSAAIVFFTAFILLWNSAGVILRKLFKTQEIPLAVAIAFLLEILVLRFSQLSHYFFSIFGQGLLVKILLFVLTPLLIPVISYFACSAIIKNGNISSKFSVVCLSLPLILAEIMICLWLLRYDTNSSLVYIIFILISVFTLWFFFRVKETHSLKKIIYLFCCIVIVSPLISLVSEGIYKSLTLRSSKEHKVKHIILIINDTLRADALSCNNPKAKPTPNIDSFSKKGILFKNTISSAPWTLPAVTSIMTGLPPSVHIVTTTNRKLSDNFVTLAERMRSEGYSTGAIGYNAVLHHSYNMSQGFNEYLFFPQGIMIFFCGFIILTHIFPTHLLQNILTGKNPQLQWTHLLLTATP